MAKIKGWKFPVDEDKATGKIMTVSDNDNIRQNINVILQTQHGERKMRPNFGADTNRFMFGNIDFLFVKLMSKQILDAIDLWEEHVPQMNVEVRQSEDDAAKVIVDIDYITDIEPVQEKLVKEIDLNTVQ